MKQMSGADRDYLEPDNPDEAGNHVEPANSWHQPDYSDEITAQMAAREMVLEAGYFSLQRSGQRLWTDTKRLAIIRWDGSVVYYQIDGSVDWSPVEIVDSPIFWKEG